MQNAHNKKRRIVYIVNGKMFADMLQYLGKLVGNDCYTKNEE